MSPKLDGVFVAQSSGVPKPPALKMGADRPDELYVAVGLALTTWEQCEDILMGLFVNMCGGAASLAAEWYVDTKSREVRIKTLNRALERHQRGIGLDKLPDELFASFKSALKETKDLADIRGKIAHSSCTKVTATLNGKLSLEGYFLIPALNEIGTRNLALRYALNPADVADFTARATTCREVFDAANSHIIVQRTKFRGSLPLHAHVILDLAKGAVADQGKVEIMLNSVELTDAGRSLAK